MPRQAFVCAAAIVLAAASVSAETQKKDVDIKASDGAVLKATYFSPGKPGPAIFLMHQCNMDRHAWDKLGADLAGAGFHVLAADLRGFGESAEHGPNAMQNAAIREKWPSDLDTAYAYLLMQSGIDKTRIAAGGASCGVGLSTELASRHREIRALIELSGTPSDAAKAYVAERTDIPIFGAASEGDTKPAQGIRDLLAASKNPRSQTKFYPGTEHGVPMFGKNPELEPMIVSWLKDQLAKQSTQ